MVQNPIREEFLGVVHDGDAAIGAVREVRPGDSDFRIDVENGGEFWVPRSAVRNVYEDKVVLDCGKLDLVLKRAIGHAHDEEDPYVADRPLPGENA